MSATPLNIDQLVDDNADVSFQGTNPMINELMIIFRNEVHCPEILEYKFDLMDSILASLQRQIKRVDEITTDAFGATFYLMEIERIKYAVARYLRARIFKIEQQAFYILNNDIVKDRLSLQERVFVDRIGELNQSHLKHTIGDNVSNARLKREMMKSEDLVKNAVPNLEEFVAVKATEDITEIIFSANAQPYHIFKGEIAMLPYDKIRNHLYNEKCQLI